MNSLKEKIDTDLKQAMLDKDIIKRNVLRSIKTSITNKETVKDAIILDDNGVLDVIKSLVKQRNQSIELFKKGNRTDLVDAEVLELEILESFLPKQLSEEETISIIKTIITDLLSNGSVNIGTVMKVLKTDYPNIDSKLASNLVKSLL